MPKAADEERKERYEIALAALNEIRGEPEAAKSFVSHRGPVLTKDLDRSLIEDGGDDLGDIQVSGLSVSDGNEDTSNVLPAKCSKNPNLMIKYSSNCLYQPTELNVLLKNFNIIKLVDVIQEKLESETEEQMPLTPSALYLSGPGPMKPGQSTRGLSFENPAQCAGADMRFMVMESAGLSLFKFTALRGVGMSVLEALTVGRNVLRSIFAIHSYGLVHGDITWRNVLFSGMDDPDHLPSPIESKFVLVDWDQAHLVQEVKKTTAVRQGKSAAHFLSPAELENGPKSLPTFYDDLYRVYELMGALMGGKNFYADSGLLRDAALAKKSGADANPLIKNKRETKWIEEYAAKSSKPFTKDKEVKKALADFHSLVHGGKNVEPARTNALELIETMIDYFAVKG